MKDDQDRLSLSREELKRLEASDEQAATVRGGADSGDACMVQIPVLPLPHFTTHIEDPGSYVAQVVTNIDFQVTDSQRVVVRRVEHVFEDPTRDDESS